MQTTRRWATKKQGASRARQKRRPAGKRFGLKKYPGEFVKQGDILVKQRGSKNHPGQNVGMGRDFTLYAEKSGYVHMTTHSTRNGKQFINIVEQNPKTTTTDLPSEHTLEFRSPLAQGYRADHIFTRDPETGERHFTLYDLNQLPPVEKTELCAVDFDPMQAHLKAMNLDSTDLAKKVTYQFGERFAEARMSGGDINQAALLINAKTVAKTKPSIKPIYASKKPIVGNLKQ